MHMYKTNLSAAQFQPEVLQAMNLLYLTDFVISLCEQKIGKYIIVIIIIIMNV